jgi:formylglycine-generating enzyme required for sulfatase activity
MKIRNLLVLLNCLATFSLAAQTNQPVIFPGDATNPGSLKLVWPATPGLRYAVQQSTNLQTWTTAPGYPAAAFGPAQQMTFQPTGNAGFYKVSQLDDQPPAIVSQYPPDGGFAVPQFANLTMQLSDATGIDPKSIQLTVGSLGTFTFTNAQLTFSNNLLTFINGGSIPLGNWGSNVQVTLIMADTLGNVGTNTWSFTLENQPQTVTNLFVFGSTQAQARGQQIGNLATRALVKSSGPIPKGSGYPWTLAQVATNFLRLAYTNTAPVFTVGQYVCNLTPASPAEIFNRKITSISNDSAHKLLTLSTVEVPLTEIATNGSVSVSSDSMILQMGTNGVFAKTLSVSGTVTFPSIGYSLDGAEFALRQDGFASTIDGVTLSVGSAPDLVHVTAEQLHWWLTPQLQASLDINWGSLQRFQAIASGTVAQAAIFDADVLLAGADVTQTIFELPPGAKPQVWVYLGSIGLVPVFASLGLDLKVKAEEAAQATLSFRSGESQTVDASFGVTYNSPNDVEWVHSFNFPPPTVVPFTASINAVASVKLSLEPEVDFLVYGLAGVSAGITPSASVVFQAGTGQPLSGDLDADVSLDIGLAGPAFDLIHFTPTYSLSLWSDEWHLFPNEANISFDRQPQSQTVTSGSSVNFSCTVAATGTPGYQWYFNGVPLPGQNLRTLLLPSVSSGYAGNYYVQVSADGQTSNSAPATLTVGPAGIQSGMALIPAGSFTMGNCMDPNDGNSGELPLHTVYVSAFYMDKYDVTYALWQQVYNWAITHGYNFDYVGSGKAASHPVQTVDWFDCVKWCNARSEMEGRVPAYYTTSAQTTVYRTGQVNVDNSSVKWNAGYRLPTEAEWEKAARGGASGQRFPWGNTISWSQANYYADPSGYAYDVNPTSGYDPTFNAGVHPFTSPVGYFAPNGYGLYDMAGNVWQWCWDWYGSYGSASQTDPRGPSSGSDRVARGGGYDGIAFSCRTAFRDGSDRPTGSIYYDVGFRSVLSPGQ